MRTTLIVVNAPRLDRAPRIKERGKDIVVEAFVAKFAIEALDECVLGRLSRRDVMQFYASRRCPRKHHEACQLGAVVHHQTFWVLAAFGGDSIEHACNARTADRSIDLDREGLAREVVDDVEGADPTAILKRIVHEVERPSFVCARRRRDDIAPTESNATLNALANP